VRREWRRYTHAGETPTSAALVALLMEALIHSHRHKKLPIYSQPLRSYTRALMKRVTWMALACCTNCHSSRRCMCRWDIRGTFHQDRLTMCTLLCAVAIEPGAQTTGLLVDRNVRAANCLISRRLPTPTTFSDSRWISKK
jgi:hypothetical protein